MACRYVLSPSYRPDMSPSERTHKVIAIVNKMVSMMEGVIQVSNTAFQPLLLSRVLPWTWCHWLVPLPLCAFMPLVCQRSFITLLFLTETLALFALGGEGGVLFTFHQSVYRRMLFRNILSTVAAVAPVRASVCLFTSQCDRLEAWSLQLHNVLLLNFASSCL